MVFCCDDEATVFLVMRWRKRLAADTKSRLPPLLELNPFFVTLTCVHRLASQGRTRLHSSIFIACQSVPGTAKCTSKCQHRLPREVSKGRVDTWLARNGKLFVPVAVLFVRSLHVPVRPSFLDRLRQEHGSREPVCVGKCLLNGARSLLHRFLGPLAFVVRCQMACTL